jgi:hypothetical protein
VDRLVQGAFLSGAATGGASGNEFRLTKLCELKEVSNDFFDEDEDDKFSRG